MFVSKVIIKLNNLLTPHFLFLIGYSNSRKSGGALLDDGYISYKWKWHLDGKSVLSGVEPMAKQGPPSSQTNEKEHEGCALFARARSLSMATWLSSWHNDGDVMFSKNCKMAIYLFFPFVVLKAWLCILANVLFFFKMLLFPKWILNHK